MTASEAKKYGLVDDVISTLPKITSWQYLDTPAH
jgi:ATP-dependent protease ClpP protease subunit